MDPYQEISLYPSMTSEGPLDWMDIAQSRADLQLPVQFLTEQSYSALRTERGRERWIVQNLRDNNLSFFYPLLHAGFGMEWAPTSETGTGQFIMHRGTLPLTRLFGLPNENPARELEQYRGFLQWIQDKRNELGNPWPTTVSLQWFRGGYSNRGIEWSGMHDSGLSEEQIAQWQQELIDWRKQPWFEALYQKNMDGLARVRIGPHCWFRMGELRNRSKEMLIRPRSPRPM
jgi:hypothetical protein